MRLIQKSLLSLFHQLFSFFLYGFEGAKSMHTLVQILNRIIYEFSQRIVTVDDVAKTFSKNPARKITVLLKWSKSFSSNLEC